MGDSLESEDILSHDAGVTPNLDIDIFADRTGLNAG